MDPYHFDFYSYLQQQQQRAARTGGRSSSSTKMPPGVPHPEAGMMLGPFTERCQCGGVTGICGTPQGAQKWRSHQRTKKHQDWDPIYNMG